MLKFHIDLIPGICVHVKQSGVLFAEEIFMEKEEKYGKKIS